MHLLPNSGSTVEESNLRLNSSKLQIALPDCATQAGHPNSITVAGNIKKISAKQSLLIVCLLMHVVCMSQQRLVLDQAVNIALKNSYDIEIARNNVTATEISNNYGVA